MNVVPGRGGIVVVVREAGTEVPASSPPDSGSAAPRAPTPTPAASKDQPSPAGATTPAQPATDPAAAPPTLPDKLEVLTASAMVWTKALSFEHDRLRGRQQLFGYLVVTITAVTGIAAFTQLDGNPAWWATLCVAIVSAIAAIIAAIQTRGDFAVRAGTAADSSKEFGALLGAMLTAGERIARRDPPAVAELDELYARYDTLRKSRPTVHPKLYRDAQHAVMDQAEVQRALAEARTR